MTFQNFLKIHQKLRWAWVIRLTIISVGVYSCVDPLQRERTAIAQTEDGKQAMQELPSDTKQLSGEVLAKAYCQACHQFPPPDLLDKHTWVNSVLPNMGERLGIKKASMSDIFGEEDPSSSNKSKTSPSIARSDWQKIIDYYKALAPDTLPPQTGPHAIPVNLPLFDEVKPELRTLPLTTLIRFNHREKQLVFGTRNNMLYILNPKTLKFMDSLKTKSVPADICFKPGGGFDLLTMGIIDPNDEEKGQVTHYSAFRDFGVKPVIANLMRPVQMAYGDLNQDNLDDIVICNFGFNVGKLSWYENTGRSYKEHVLKNLPGARRTILFDWNKDGLLDILVLMSQGQEGIYWFKNLGRGKFDEQQLLSFPPVYGSSDFELIDFNKDGEPDILYTNGDNGDLSPTLKNYHGVRLFLNNRKGKLQQAWFYPQNGAYKALARDFDLDGDLDIASIAFFPDFVRQPEESFIYFENKNGKSFKPVTFEKKPSGRWLLMEVADIDSDGDEDILLGSIQIITSSVTRLSPERFIMGPPLLILKNNVRSDLTKR